MNAVSQRRPDPEWYQTARMMRLSGKSVTDISRGLKKEYDAVRVAVRGIVPARKELPDGGKLWDVYGIRSYSVTRRVYAELGSTVKTMQIRMPFVSILEGEVRT
jgi:hypothetical protein